MTKEIKMPDISEDADSGTVVEILVKEGDTIEEEQSIVAIESDKASVEVPSPEGGTVKEIKIAEGDELKVGDVILVLEMDGNGEADEDEDTEEDKADNKKKKKKPAKQKDNEAEEDTDEEETEEKEEEVTARKEPKEKKKPQKDDEEEPADEADEEEGKSSDQQETTEASKPQDKESRQEVPAAPSVRRMSRELGVDIYQVKGSGRGGRITADDVKAYADNGKQSGGKESKTPQQETALPDFAQWGDIRREKMSGIRKATARSMADAWQTVPHVTQFDKADITKLQEYTAQYEEKAAKAGGKLTITAILLKVSAAALRAFPKFNASVDIDKQEVIYKKYYHIGVAVDTDKGLLVPVVRDVDQKSVIKLSAELPAIAEKAREGKLSSEDMQGGSFTVSNLGGIGGTQFTPIVYKPQVAILGISRTQTEPVYIDDAFQPRQMLPLSLSYDHRLIDGAEAARFLRWICQSLEDPFVMLMEG